MGSKQKKKSGWLKQTEWKSKGRGDNGGVEFSDCTTGITELSFTAMETLGKDHT